MAAANTEDSEVKITINNVLCYISSARHSLRCDDIIRTCLVFYENDDIVKAKDMLFEMVGEKPKRRRFENRMMHELQDIIDMLKRCDDEESLILPRFVADSFSGMPPSSGFEIVAQAMQSLIQEISDLKKEIVHLKDNRLVSDVQQQNNILIQEDLLVIKGEIRKINLKLVGEEIRRNSLVLETLDRSSQGLRKQGNVAEVNNNGSTHDLTTESDPAELIEDIQQSFGNTASLSPSAPPASQEHWSMLYDEGGPPTAPTYADVTQKSDRRTTNTLTAQRSPSVHTVTEGHRKDTRSRPPKAVAARGRYRSNSSDKSDGFKLVQSRKRQKKNIIGARKLAGNIPLKSATRLGDLYLGNCDIEVTPESIIEYIHDITKVDIVKCDPLKSKNVHCKSFKLTMNMNDRSTLLNSDVWPEGILCRKFFSPPQTS